MHRAPLTAAALAGGLLALAPAPALAEETVCRGGLGAVTVDDLLVPQDASCSLSGTTVKGSVRIERAATLAASGIAVVGNVQAEGARRVGVSGSRIGGSVQVVQGGGADVRQSVVGGDVQLFANGGTASTVVANTIDGNLQCKENAPAPTGGDNRVGGNAEDQCAGLAGGAGAGSAPAGTAPAPAPAPAPVSGSSDDDDDLRVVRVQRARSGARVVARVRCADDDRCREVVRLVVRDRTVAKRTVALAPGRSATVRLTVPRKHRAAVRAGLARVRADD